MTRFWVSWWDEEDARPKTWPPPPEIKGFWHSGTDADDRPAVCAMIDAESEGEVCELVEEHWTISEWRFRETVADDYRPGDRFPIPKWAEDRWKPKEG